MASEANAAGEESAEVRLGELARQLADGIEAALPAWVERSVAGLCVAWEGEVPSAVAEQARAAGLTARADVGAAVRELLVADVDAQWTNPMSIVRRAVVHPTEVLRSAGVPPVERDAEARRQFPDDDYDLTPTSFADLDPGLRDIGIAWGAAKAFVVTSRRRDEGRR